MTAVEPISGTIPPTGVQTGSTTPPAERKKTLDSEVFLKLLVTQLTNQDPSSPMNTNEMISQTTQLASMEQLTALTATSTESFALSMRQTAAALIGHEAQYVDEKGVTQKGIVTSVSYAGPIPLVTIGEASIPLDAVSGVSVAPRPQS
ncbi:MULTISPECIES: flagellar hook assembly protein FlgD [unclassified Microbacterium]|uniref:flagellar hook assembly protein FlgD n=1 Tax=unclassified Microbacterium TaxID=2609290 RepID=UPI000425A6B5|nr:MULTISPECIES: flagellar hook capping FlgD N-terminal domain-containing protein [unclassified Microbacterium]PQZ55012.1 flagellar hook capping protein [Microbacterium sp. MYb43]PQZ81543.1 flagellar hook capping protein [Microbacterium sp. MYb40]PRB21525.1 flagellar hook capping protein [Microbacterium sp. MYb54]PRB30090.1 flagellar hook capping protein [Microbacterium sp. MYb50]PRB67752.1 flagellar hook capping protein [Microbacterium sp. MYb24]